MDNNEIKKIERDFKKDDDVRKLINENLKLTKEIHEMIRYVKRFVILNQVLGVIKILLIAVPIVLGVLYLPPLLDQLFNQYREILGVTKKVEDLQNASKDVSGILDTLKK